MWWSIRFFKNRLPRHELEAEPRPALCGERPAGWFDICRLKPLNQIPERTEEAVAEIGDMTRGRERLLAFLQGRLHLCPTPSRECDAPAGYQLAVEPGRAVMADLLVKTGC
jgi:hypothetical protein